MTEHRRKLTLLEIQRNARISKNKRIQSANSRSTETIDKTEYTQDALDIKESDRNQNYNLEKVLTIIDKGFEVYVLVDQFDIIFEILIYQFGLKNNIEFEDYTEFSGNRLTVKGLVTGNQLFLTAKSANNRNGSRLLNVKNVNLSKLQNWKILQPLTYYMDIDLLGSSYDGAKTLDDVKTGYIKEIELHQQSREIEEEVSINSNKSDSDGWKTIYPFQCAIRRPSSVWLRTQASIFANNLEKAEKEKNAHAIAYCDDDESSIYVSGLFNHDGLAIYQRPIPLIKGKEICEFCTNMDDIISLTCKLRDNGVPIAYNFIDVTDRKKNNTGRLGIYDVGDIVDENLYCLILVGSEPNK